MLASSADAIAAAERDIITETTATSRCAVKHPRRPAKVRAATAVVPVIAAATMAADIVTDTAAAAMAAMDVAMAAGVAMVAAAVVMAGDVGAMEWLAAR
jgi:hypothetical protein